MSLRGRRASGTAIARRRMRAKFELLLYGRVWALAAVDKLGG